MSYHWTANIKRGESCIDLKRVFKWKSLGKLNYLQSTTRSSYGTLRVIGLCTISGAGRKGGIRTTDMVYFRKAQIDDVARVNKESIAWKTIFQVCLTNGFQILSTSESRIQQAKVLTQHNRPSSRGLIFWSSRPYTNV